MLIMDECNESDQRHTFSIIFRALNGGCSISKKPNPWRTLPSSCLRAFSWLRNLAISFKAESQPSELLKGPVRTQNTQALKTPARFEHQAKP